ncbi:putative transcriptional regulator domain protein [Clostridioides difficile CD160]|nr:putative transcriptional regulator domain protein [Clostridioides difficile CD160]
MSNRGYIDMHIPKYTLNWVAEYLLFFAKNTTIIEYVQLKSLIKSKVLESCNHHYL